ncbi:hypothetical protein A3Q56_00150 [Intoshia linei]|uniref:5-formyltetrahydrofolate cyclo-ligase n=1 Tax=Intoshia linei TaxID=1819745 RepID=A0A177BCP2_9BILA|nr:hypothetical protein A3Q56_00150 [Intoshia linei]
MSLKEKIRKEIKEILLNLSFHDRKTKSLNIFNQLKQNTTFQKCKKIGLYLNMHDEVNTENLIKYSFRKKKEIYIPYFDDKEMTMVRLPNYKQLKKTTLKLNVRQFDVSKLNKIDSVSAKGFLKLDLIILPGRAFTKYGVRLGRGKGYFDKYLCECTKQYLFPHLMGICFREQLYEQIPKYKHDINVNTPTL